MPIFIMPVKSPLISSKLPSLLDKISAMTAGISKQDMFIRKVKNTLLTN